MTSKDDSTLSSDQGQQGTSGPQNTGSDDDPTLGNGRSWTQAAQSHFDPDDGGDLTTAIVTTIAAAEGVDPTELTSPVLYDVVDASAIQQSFFGSNASAHTATGSTQFRYDGYLVKVRSDGWIQVYE